MVGFERNLALTINGFITRLDLDCTACSFAVTGLLNLFMQLHAFCTSGLQQYQKLESQGNPRLETLEIIAAGLNAQLMLIPDDKVHLIRQLLNDEIKVTIEDQDDLMTNPWKGLLGGEEP